MLELGHVPGIGHAPGERGLVDQAARAAIVQHISDFRLLLAGAEQDGDQPLLRGREQDQWKFDAVAEQDRDAVAGLEAELAETGGDALPTP